MRFITKRASLISSHLNQVNTIRTMSTFKLQGSTIEVTLTPDLSEEELLEFPAFKVLIFPSSLLPLPPSPSNLPSCSSQSRANALHTELDLNPPAQPLPPNTKRSRV